MQAQFWHNAWDTGKTGWKQRSVNSHLRQHWSALEVPAGAKVLVPLCGDTQDMVWLLEQGYEVVGSELSEAAVRHFFAEHFGSQALQASKSQDTGHTVYKTDRVCIYCGDFFTLTAAQLGPLVAAYDRAATVAMPAELRPVYAQKMQELVAPGGSVMLIAFEYDQQKMDGPPFSVTQEEVEQLYAEKFNISQLSTQGGPEYLGNLADRGLETLTETVYQMVRR